MSTSNNLTTGARMFARCSFIAAMSFFAGLFTFHSAMANETNSRFGDRSWQFQTPSDRVVKQNNLILHCQHDPANCDQNNNGTDGTRGIGGDNGSNGDNASGDGLNLGGGDSIIGNNITVVIEGDGNVVEITGDQSLTDSPQTINHTVSDNELIVDYSNNTITTSSDSSDDEKTNEDEPETEQDGDE